MVIEKTVQVKREHLGLPTILFLIFLVLQLTGYIDWPWYAVAAPLLIPLGIWVFFAVVMLVIGVRS
jgi:tryptophan-rich sensory protein